uniref:Uncharacterized protein n=1 Tax=Setaria italica TaxID=4555 RepID=K4AEW7_SETIT
MPPLPPRRPLAPLRPAAAIPSPLPLDPSPSSSTLSPPLHSAHAAAIPMLDVGLAAPAHVPPPALCRPAAEAATADGPIRGASCPTASVLSGPAVLSAQAGRPSDIMRLRSTIGSRSPLAALGHGDALAADANFLMPCLSAPSSSSMRENSKSRFFCSLCAMSLCALQFLDEGKFQVAGLSTDEFFFSHFAISFFVPCVPLVRCVVWIAGKESAARNLGDKE